MSQFPSVLVAVGQSKNAKLPRQKYKNIFTRYNMGGMATVPDRHFFNEVVRNPSIPNKKQFDIYGFILGGSRYTTNHSIQDIVDFFDKHEHIKVVICDVVDGQGSFKFCRYIQPQATNNVPFFIRESVTQDINFTDDNAPLQHQLEALKQKYTIFHIASPLISI